MKQPEHGARARDPGLVLIAASVVASLLLASAFGPYGYFIDEFYYLACARRPALGYVDHPPLAPLILAATRAVLGQSMLAIRILPALSAGATVLVTGKIALEAGAGPFAARLAALAVACMPITLVVGSFYSMNAFEQLSWAFACLLVSRIARGAAGAERHWLWLGLVIGVSFLSKHTVVIFVAGLAVAVALTPMRRWLRTRWPWLGAAIALGAALPNLAWQAQHDFVSLDFYRGATESKNIALSPLGVLVQQLLVLHPLLAPIWAPGAVMLLASRRLRDLRWAGIAWWLLLALLVLSGTSRPDRIAGFAPMLFVAGAISWERWLSTSIRRGFALAFTALSGLALAPLNLPLLGHEVTARYAARLGVVPKIERGKTSPLPQWLADRTGWPAMVDEVERVVRGLSPEEQRAALIYTDDYGHAGALELWRDSRDLPPVISPHNSYFHFSLGKTDSDVLIAIGPSEETLRKSFSDVRRAGTIRCTYCMSWRNGRTVWVARRPTIPLSAHWRQLRRYH